MKKFIALLSLSLLLAVSGCAGGTKPETQSATYPNIEDGTYDELCEKYELTVPQSIKDGSAKEEVAALSSESAE